MTVAEQGRSQTGVDGDDQHHARNTLASAEPNFGQTGDISQGVLGSRLC